MQATFIGLLALVVGIVLCFGGHRLFRVLMVLVGFAVGFVLGGSGVAAVTRGQFLDSLYGWIAAGLVGLVLGGLAIPFYAAGVAVLGGVVAYLVTSGVMVYIGYGTGTLTQAAGIVAGAVAVVLIYLFRVHRLLVMTVTATAGAAGILAGVLILLSKLAFDLPAATDPTAVIRSTPIWLLLVIVLVLAGVGAQWRTRSRPVPAARPMVTQAAPAVPPSAPTSAPPSQAESEPPPARPAEPPVQP